MREKYFLKLVACNSFTRIFFNDVELRLGGTFIAAKNHMWEFACGDSNLG
jgi:hypothetical protein